MLMALINHFAYNIVSCMPFLNCLFLLKTMGPNEYTVKREHLIHVVIVVVLLFDIVNVYGHGTVS